MTAKSIHHCEKKIILRSIKNHAFPKNMCPRHNLVEIMYFGWSSLVVSKFFHLALCWLCIRKQCVSVWAEFCWAAPHGFWLSMYPPRAPWFSCSFLSNRYLLQSKYGEKLASTVTLQVTLKGFICFSCIEE